MDNFKEKLDMLEEKLNNLEERAIKQGERLEEVSIKLAAHERDIQILKHVLDRTIVLIEQMEIQHAAN